MPPPATEAAPRGRFAGAYHLGVNAPPARSVRAFVRLLAQSVLLLCAAAGCAQSRPAGPGKAHVAESSDSRPDTSPGVRLVGTTFFPGNTRDLSGLDETLAQNVRQDLLGGHGSAIAWRGGDRYWMLSDRGPHEGSVAFLCRMHAVQIGIDPDHLPAVTCRLVATTMLRTAAGRAFSGSSEAGDFRLDPEGIRPGPDGSCFVSDEYGPHLIQFDAAGHEIRRLPVPAAFHPHHGGGKPRGRDASRGFEGLAISPDGRMLWALLQSPLLQDGGDQGVNVRLLSMDLHSLRTREYVVVLDHHEYGFHELLAVTDQQFLAIERDAESGRHAAVKRIVRLDLRDATDVSNVAALPAEGLPPEIHPVRKSAFIDLLDPRFGLAGKTFAEKEEGLTFGPDPSATERTLIVTTDNDLEPDVPTWIWVVGVPRALLDPSTW